MRVLPFDEHQARKEKILQAVIHLFIKTSKPVGSSTLVESTQLNLSPATIRNVLAELEKEGYLTHPHTSAGRMPTDRGYRFYVDSIVKIQRLAAEEEERIRQEYFRRRRELEDLMQSATRVLSTLSHCTGFVLPPKVAEEKLMRVELIPLSASQILGVLISETGLVRNQLIDIERMPEEETLRRAARFLNERLSGLNFSEAPAKLTTELELFHREEALQAELLSHLASELFDAEVGRKGVYLEGTGNIFKFPEFQDYDGMRQFAQLVDEKQALGQLLAGTLSTKGLQVSIGSEVHPELKDFSVVSSGYEVNGRPVGVLGILGPKRMEYARMMSIVNSVADMLSRHLEGRGTLPAKERP